MTEQAKEWMTRAEFADYMQVSRPAVSQAVKIGRITVNSDQLIHRQQAEALWNRNKRSTVKSSMNGKRQDWKAKNEAPQAKLAPTNNQTHPDYSLDIDPPAYDISRARREAADAILAELKVGEQSGALIEVAAVRRVLGGALSATREAMQHLSARLSPVLAAESNPKQVSKILDEEINQALIHLSTKAATLTAEPE